MPAVHDAHFTVNGILVVNVSRQCLFFQTRSFVKYEYNSLLAKTDSNIYSSLWASKRREIPYTLKVAVGSWLYLKMFHFVTRSKNYNVVPTSQSETFV